MSLAELYWLSVRDGSGHVKAQVRRPVESEVNTRGLWQLMSSGILMGADKLQGTE